VVNCSLVRTRWRKRCKWLAKGSYRLLLKRGCISLEVWYQDGRGIYPWRLHREGDVPRASVVFPLVSRAVKKRAPAGAPVPGDGPKHLAPLLTKSMSGFPNLVMFCAVVKYDDGDPRQAGWIQVRTDGSAWKVILKDTDTASQMTCLGNTLDDALALAELYAGADDAPWEPDPWARKNSMKGKK
jgi:hypothetical protein